MSFDTKYRPLDYSDVLGQDASVAVLKQFVQSGTGFHQSYLFSGPHGSGKTTLGRILARALLCEDPQEGSPCDECPSCRSILDRGSSEDFTELDAATKSGKDNVLKIIEELQYSTFSGKRRIYLFDEAHRLSANALDALLKPMEDTVPGSQEKYMVCIFCTTEPEKVRATVFSRCAPAFTIRVVPPEEIAQRLALICVQEGIEYSQEALVTVAEFAESHIRDAIKTVEGVSQLGPVTAENVTRYLRLDTNVTLLQILALLGSDVGKAMTLASEVCQVISPSSAYQRLAEAAMLAYQSYVGAGKPPVYWRPEITEKLGRFHKEFLVTFAARFASRPGKPTVSMLQMDIAHLHQVRQGIQPTPTTQVAVSTVIVPSVGVVAPPDETSGLEQGKVQASEDIVKSEVSQVAYETEGGIYVDPRAIRKRIPSAEKQNPLSGTLNPSTFCEVLGVRVRELRSSGGRSARRHHLGDPGVDQER